MSDRLDRVLYMICVCETVTDIRMVLQNVTDEELEDLKRFCRKTALDKIRNSSKTIKTTTVPFTFGTGLFQPKTIPEEGLFQQKTIKSEEMDTISHSILISAYPLYKLFQQRLNTFLNQWNYEYIVSGKTLAEAGFINMKKGTDAVSCVFCGLELGEWKRGDCPWFDHYRHNKDCMYVCKMRDMYPQVNNAITEGERKQSQDQCDFNVGSFN